MKNEKETKGKLLISAKQEFMEKGYMKASLRNICKNAGVTTGALYFFFQDKESLFASIVEEPLKKLYEIMNNHYQEEKNQVDSGMTSKENFFEDLEVAKQVLHYIYQYYVEFQLIITKGQGSKFEQSIEQFVDMTEKHYRLLADTITERANKERVDDTIIHWIAHMQIDSFVHMLTHEKSEEAALKHMRFMIQYLIFGWNGMFEKD